MNKKWNGKENINYKNAIETFRKIYENVENKKIKISQLNFLFNGKEEKQITNELKLIHFLKDKGIEQDKLYEKLKKLYHEFKSNLKNLKSFLED